MQVRAPMQVLPHATGGGLSDGRARRRHLCPAALPLHTCARQWRELASAANKCTHCTKCRARWGRMCSCITASMPTDLTVPRPNPQARWWARRASGGCCTSTGRAVSDDTGVACACVTQPAALPTACGNSLLLFIAAAINHFLELHPSIRLPPRRAAHLLGWPQQRRLLRQRQPAVGL